MLLVRICWGPPAAVLPAAKVLDFEFWISNLFGISILGFRIFRFGCGHWPRSDGGKNDSRILAPSPLLSRRQWRGTHRLSRPLPRGATARRADCCRR